MSKQREIWVLFTPESPHIAHAQNRLDLMFNEIKNSIYRSCCMLIGAT